MSPTMIGTGLSSPRMEGDLENTVVTVELNIGSEVKE